MPWEPHEADAGGHLETDSQRRAWTRDEVTDNHDERGRGEDPGGVARVVDLRGRQRVTVRADERGLTTVEPSGWTTTASLSWV